MRDNALLLQDMIAAADNIGRYVALGKSRFESDELVQTFIVHQIQIIGEAATRLSDDFKSQESHTPWKLIVGMRNILVHVYFGVDLEQVWSTAVTNIPDFKGQIQEALAKLMATPQSP